MRKIRLFLIISLIISYGFAFSRQDTDSLMNEVVRHNQNVFSYDGKTKVDVPGTDIRIIPPSHFTLYDTIQGFIHNGSSSTIQVNDIIRGPYVFITPKLTSEYFAKQGFTLVSKQDTITKSGMQASIYTVTFTASGTNYERLMIFTGDYERTIWVNANYPVVMRFLLGEVLKESLLSVEFKD